MSMILESVQTEGIAELSYLIGDDKTGTAAVIDPRADVEIYVERNVAITHVFETHIHADLVSGARELAARMQSTMIFVSEEGNAKYAFAMFKSRDLQSWEEHQAISLPGWQLFNSSVCKAGERYVMAIEVGAPPEVAGTPFTMRFAESKDLAAFFF